MSEDLERLIADLVGEDQGLRVTACLQLINLGASARARVIDVLASPSNSEMARLWAAIALTRIPDDVDGRVCEALRAALRAPEPGVRAAAIEALGRQGATVAAADIAAHLTDVEEISYAWYDENRTPAQHAERALRLLGTPEALALLSQHAG
jgi:HEAT repeat protein